MKENKGKEAVDEGVRSQPRPPTGEKRKHISSRVDLGDLPSRRGKDKQHTSSRPQAAPQGAKFPPPSSLESPVQILDPEPRDPSSRKVASTIHAPTSSSAPREVPQNLLENEDLSWERFSKAVTDVDVGACYNMSLKDFEHSGVHDLFKVSS